MTARRLTQSSLSLLLLLTICFAQIAPADEIAASKITALQKELAREKVKRGSSTSKRRAYKSIARKASALIAESPDAANRFEVLALALQCQKLTVTIENTDSSRKAMLDTPALIKAYLRLGGVVGDGAYVDHAFNTTDVCLVLDTAKMNERQRRIYEGGRNSA